MRRWALASLAATLSLAGSAGDAFASGYANAVLADNPQLYWRLGEDASTGTATDRAGHYDGTYTRWNPGKGTSQPRTASPVPSALPADPDGAQAFPMNTYVETPPLPAFDTGAIEFWMRNTSTAPEASPPGNANMLWRGSDPPPSTGYWSLSGQGYACCDGALSTPAFINGTLVDYGGTIFSSGWMREEPAWHHYVARWTSTTIELWRDGQQFGSISTCCGQTSPAGERIRIGNVDHTGATTGATWELDDVAVYADLPPARIAVHYEARFAPTVTRPPTILEPSGGYQRGAELHFDRGQWTGPAAGYFVRWLRCRPDGTGCAPITGAISDTYALQSSDVGQRLALRLTVANEAGSDVAESELTPVVQPMAPSSQTPPVVASPAVIRDGNALTTTPGTWSGDPPDRYDYAWSRCDPSGGACEPITGANDYAYTASADDVGHSLRAVVTAINLGGSGSATSDPTSVVQALPPENTRPPAIRGVAREGELLAGDDGIWGGSHPGFHRAWLRCAMSCAQIPGVSDTSYQLTRDDIGFTVRYQVTATNNAGEITALSEPLGPVASARDDSAATVPPPVVVAPTPGGPTSSSLVDNGPENGRNLAGTPSLSLQFTSNQRALETLPFGQAAVLSGRVTNERGESIPGATITMEERPTVGGDFHLIGDVLSDQEGSYSAQVGPGPSRLIRATYRSHRLDRDPAATAQVQLAVAASGQLGAVRKRLRLGDQAVFRGRLVGDPFPSTGVPVTLEAKDGPRWSEVARQRTSRAGAFEFRYRFCRTIRSYTYAFRVSIGQTAGWPYDPGGTNTTRVLVRVPRRSSRATVRRCR